MKKNCLIIALLFISVSIANATVWRLNNAPGTDAHFTTLQAAHNSPLVLDGDTLYLEASSGTYGNLISTKKLIIIGSGFFSGENLNSQANIGGSRVGTIRFDNGSDGSSIMGCYLIANDNVITINASNLIIERNYISAIYGQWSTNSTIIFLGNTNNTIIRNNYIQSTHTSASYGGASTIRCSNSANNVIISNNYIEMNELSNTNTRVLFLESTFSGAITNNLIRGRVFISNSSFYNNILREGTFSSSNSTITNNIGNSTQFGTNNGNQSNVNMADVFVGTGSTDGQWQLKEGSPAIGAGLGGVDCGMFGGANPYILSGIPAIPAIYKFEMEVDNVEQKIDVEVSVKSRN